MLKEKAELPEHKIIVGFDIKAGDMKIGSWRKIIHFKASCKASQLSSPKADASGTSVAFEAQFDLFNTDE